MGPVEATYYEHDPPTAFEPNLPDNDVFFSQTLPGREKPLGSPGGATKLGAVGVDTARVASDQRS